MIPGFGLLYDECGDFWCNSFVDGWTSATPTWEGWYLIGRAIPVESFNVLGEQVLQALFNQLQGE